MVPAEKRLTTRRVDAFNERELLALERGDDGWPIWLISGRAERAEWDAMFNHQRWGYFASTREGQPSNEESKLGWQITAEGRAALAEHYRRQRA